MRLTTKWITSSLAFLALAIGCLISPLAAPAEGAAVQNPDVAKYLGEAQKLSAKKQWSEALVAVGKAQAVPEKSAYAERKINEFRAYLFTQQGKHAEAAAVFEQMASSKQTSAADRSGRLKTAAQLYYHAREYQRAAGVARQALAWRSDDTQLLEILAQADYLAGDFKNAASTLRQLVTSLEKAGTKPKESWLQLLLNSYDRLQDRTSASTAWMLLLRHYPKPEYWRAVLSARTAGQQPPLLELGYQRLMFDLGMLTEPADFEDLAMEAIDAGAPGEAVRVLQAGFEQKIVTGRDEVRFRRMLDYAKQAAAKRRAQLDELTRNAERASTGQLSMALGRLHLGEGRYAEAAAALSEGLKKGSLSDPEQGRIDLGIALLKSHQREAARKAFEAVSDKSEWHDLAQLWSLHTQ